WWDTNIGIPYSGVCFATFVLASLGWVPLNEVGFWQKDVQTAMVVKTQGGSLEKFLDTAMQVTETGEPFYVLLTLKSGKVYVGRIVSAFEPGHRDQSILLFPTLSGYRDKETQEISWSIDYDDVYTRMEQQYGEEKADQLKEEFRIVLPLSEIISTTRFDYDVYFAYFN